MKRFADERAAVVFWMVVLLLSLLYILDSNRAFAAPEKEEAVPSEQPTVYLTFDDGPSKLTPQVLDILREFGVKATFFILGELAEGREETVRRIWGEGHALGNHTYDHKYERLYNDFLGFWGQVEKTDEILTRITGEQVRLLRAPGGTHTNFDEFYFHNLREAGFQIFDWNADSGDSKRRGVPASEIVRNVKHSKLRHEVILLLHDGAGHEETVKALPEIIRYYQEEGYRFAVLDESVKSVTFRAGKLKWDRVVTEQDREQALLAINKLKKAELEQQQSEWIALRDWAAGKGRLTWDPVAKTAALALGGETLEFSPSAADAAGLSVRFEHNRFYLLKTEADSLLKDYFTA